MPLEINVITDTSRASLVLGTISQDKAGYQLLLWKDNGERRGTVDLNFSVLLL